MDDLYHLAQPTTRLYSWHGYRANSDLDIRYHFGLETNLYTLSGPDPVLYERSFQIGPRFVFPVGRRFVPYAKAMAGRGISDFAALDSIAGNSAQIANLGYNTQSFGAVLTCECCLV